MIMRSCHPAQFQGPKIGRKKSVANLQRRPISQFADKNHDLKPKFIRMKHGILLHESHDDVGVAVVDLKKGSTIGAVTLEGRRAGSVKLRDNVPLGHKVAMRDLPLDKQVIKYGRPVGRTVKAIARGAHVHVHNVKTLRWNSHNSH
jgi:(2R)-sulfolactate sulfo-lyase subunit alpha